MLRTLMTLLINQSRPQLLRVMNIRPRFFAADDAAKGNKEASFDQLMVWIGKKGDAGSKQKGKEGKKEAGGEKKQKEKKEAGPKDAGKGKGKAAAPEAKKEEKIVVAPPPPPPPAPEPTPDPKVKEKLQAKMKEILEEQKKAGQEWAKTFDEECFKYEKEWKKIVDAKEKE